MRGLHILFQLISQLMTAASLLPTEEWIPDGLGCSGTSLLGFPTVCHLHGCGVASLPLSQAVPLPVLLVFFTDVSSAPQGLISALPDLIPMVLSLLHLVLFSIPMVLSLTHSDSPLFPKVSHPQLVCPSLS